MGTLWQFFGFPDPESPTPESVKKQRKKRASQNQEASGQQLKLVNPDDEAPESNALLVEDKASSEDEPIRDIPPPVRKAPPLPKGWNGPVTPDGEPFHDLSNYSGKSDDFPERALRYVIPDQMHRLPIRQIQDRIMRGDTIIVDLNSLIHMDTQTNACRRALKHAGDEMNVQIFALDEEDKLLLIPGHDVSMDVSRNDLGLTPLLI